MPAVRVRLTRYGKPMTIPPLRLSDCFINIWSRGIINPLHYKKRNSNSYETILFSGILLIGLTLFSPVTLRLSTKKDSPGSGLSVQSVAVRFYFFRSEKERKKKSTLFKVILDKQN